jgi:hypothetical protein
LKGNFGAGHYYAGEGEGAEGAPIAEGGSGDAVPGFASVDEAAMRYVRRGERHDVEDDEEGQESV